MAFAGLTVNLFLLYSKGYSPQFLVYVVPFAVLTLPPLRAVGYLAALGALNLLEFPVYLTIFPDQPWLLRDLVVARTVFLLLMNWEYLAVLQIVLSGARVRRFAAAGSLFALAIWGAMALPAAGQGWVRTSLDRNPNAPVVDYLAANARSDSVVLFSEQWLYRELYPYLYQRTNLLLVDPTSEEIVLSNSDAIPSDLHGRAHASSPLSQLANRYREVYWVRHVDDWDGRRIEQLLARENRLEAARRVRELAVSRWSTGR